MRWGIIIGGNTAPSAMAHNTTVMCRFSEPDERTATDLRLNFWKQVTKPDKIPIERFYNIDARDPKFGSDVISNVTNWGSGGAKLPSCLIRI